MTARHEGDAYTRDVWSRIAAPLPAGSTSWRQDGRPIQRGERWFARFVVYVEANTVRERLDSVVPGEWDLTLDLLPSIPGAPDDAKVAFKARLQILGVIREDVGYGKDYKSASTDAFKRVAVRFGIAHELYAYEQNWVQVDGDGRYAKPLEDPQAAYQRRFGTPAAPRTEADRAAAAQANANGTTRAPKSAGETVKCNDCGTSYMASRFDSCPECAERAQGAPPPDDANEPQRDEHACPKCGGRTWDNRASKRNPRAPDFKCRDRSCDGVIWPPRQAPTKVRPAPPEDHEQFGPAESYADENPF